MSIEPQPRDIKAATKTLADTPFLIFQCFSNDAFRKELVLNCYEQSEALRESFAKIHAERIHTMAMQVAAERSQEEADEAAEDARWENAA